MDTRNDRLAAYAVDLPGLAGCKIVVGAKQLRKAMNAGRVRQVFLAKNADPTLTDPIAELCKRNRLDCVWVRSMADLGRACGIEVGAAAAAAVD